LLYYILLVLELMYWLVHSAWHPYPHFTALEHLSPSLIHAACYFCDSYKFWQCRISESLVDNWDVHFLDFVLSHKHMLVPLTLFSHISICWFLWYSSKAIWYIKRSFGQQIIDFWYNTCIFKHIIDPIGEHMASICVGHSESQEHLNL